MSLLSSCASCLRLESLLTPGGLCTECAANGVTAVATPRVAPGSGGPTVSHLPPPSELDALPATGVPSAPDTDGAPAGRGSLPHSPPGYELVRLLGEGGMGDVYLAREQPSGRPVAIKFLRHPEHIAGFQRFVTELQTLARIDHPNIVRLFASDFLRATPYFTMEYMEGGALSGALAAGPLSAAEAVRAIRAVAAAVAAAHAAGVVHRDLKPSNILRGADGVLKVADFGLAKSLDEADGLTNTTAALGTPGYMPPEQVSRSHGAVGFWSDVYGLGATLYHLLTGRAPFVGRTAEEVIPRVLTDAPARPRALRPDIPLALEGIVLKCLAKAPADRYQTVAAFLTDLDAYAAGHRPVAPPLTRARRARQWAGRNRAAVAAAVAVAAVAVGLVGAGRAMAPVPPVSMYKPVPPPAPPADPLAEIQRDLAAGKQVTLIGAKGLPRWHEWRLTPSTLVEDVCPDAACGFQTSASAMLVLLPDPGIDRYRFTVELQQLGRSSRYPTDFLGAFFGVHTRDVPNARRATTFLLARYHDVVRVVPDSPPIRNWAECACGAVVESDQIRQGHYVHQLGNATFAAPVRFPAPWRQFIVDVTPAVVRVYWRDTPTSQQVLVYEWTGEELTAQYAGLKTWIDKGLPDNGLTRPVWHPRMPLGVWGYQSIVAIRNAVVGPIPP